MPAMIVLGDKTNHGGEVMEASAATDTHGKRVARVGDKVFCPKKGHGTTEIVTGDNRLVIDGKAVAYHGCKTSCGATLISSQMFSWAEFADDAPVPLEQGSADAGFGRLSAHEQSTSSFDEQFRAVDEDSGRPIPGLAYFVRVGNGASYSGFTDAQGLIPRTHTEEAQNIEVWLGVAALHMWGASHD